jgi:5-methylcytosine-specific restriction endonuclease McrA
MNLTKPKRIVNEKLLAEIRKLNCIGCGRRGAEAHHVTTRGSGGDDVPDNLMPLCRICHTKIHQIGTSKMAEKHSGVKHWLMSHGREDMLKGKS